VTLLSEPPVEAQTEPGDTTSSASAVPPVAPKPQRDTREADPGPPVGVGLTCAAVAFSTIAAGWMLGGVFAGTLPKIAALVASVVGPLVVLLSYRTRRPGIVQYLVLPGALLGGALFVLPATTGGSANIVSLIGEAVRNGGLGQPPVPFEPGWRFLLVVLLAVLGTGAASLGVSGDRPRLAAAVPLPVVVGAALVQPSDSAAINSVVAIVLMVGALILASGAQLAQEESSSARFEARRLVRGLGALVALAVILVPLSQAGFLFPDATDDRVVPPTRPKAQPPLSDRVLFTVVCDKDDQGPWRFGVIDGYNGEAWLLPPYDVARFVDLEGEGDLAEATSGLDPDPADGPVGVPTGKPGRTVTFSVGDLPGRVLPVVEGVQQVNDRDVDVQFDPRTQTLRSPAGRAKEGSSYTVVAAAPPDAKILSAAPKPDAELLASYLVTPTAPDEVTALLAQAPQDNNFRRLQFVRNALYAAVVASGKGEPVDVPPSRVPEMLAGGKATPYEITAAEALIARWAGIPARIGYGFYSGTRNKADTGFDVHPRDGATWLEAYFPGPGWVTIVGKPPKAQASTSQEQKDRDESIKATDDLALIVHVPVELDSLQQFYETARYWAVVSLPWVALIVFLLVFYPAGLKQVRQARRRRWARSAGPAGRIVAAYAELRDRLRDVNAQQPTATPLEFVSAVDYDDEHWELAWLVTRGLYGDLARDLRNEDAHAAESMARSVTRRVLRGQRLVTRALGQASRTSLREPYTLEIPNFWPSGARVRRLKGRVRRIVRAASPLRLVRGLWRIRPRRLANASVVLLLVLGLVGCGNEPAPPPPPLPVELVPQAVGEYFFKREPAAERAFTDAGDRALVANGRVITVRRGKDGKEVLGSLQAAEFKPAIANDKKKAQRSLLRSLGDGQFELRRFGSYPVHELVRGERRILLYFPPGGGYYELLDARAGFTDADRVFAAILDFQTGAKSVTSDVVLPDPRRGGDS
jgi:hypothetical protein